MYIINVKGDNYNSFSYTAKLLTLDNLGGNFTSSEVEGVRY